jgi:Family of unknown function (DUF6228)
MNSFVIRSASGAGSLEFFERTPTATSRPIERFKVRLTDHELSAVGRVYFADASSDPGALFTELAATWRGRRGELAWESPAGELTLRCTQDRAGHVFLRVELRSGPSENDWTAQATIVAEAGQLDELANQAAQFFGLGVARV